MPLKPDRIRAITLDLDDTLWPVQPVIARAESALHAWFARHAPRVTARYDAAALRSVREAVAREFPEWAHDLTAQRLESIRRVLVGAGEDEALAEAAFETFFAERQRVDLFDEVAQALPVLARRWPLMALSNGNADIHRVGLGEWFRHSVSARQVGVGKPHRRIFEAACERLECAPHEVLHIGDDWALDIVGAREAGLQTAWVRRQELAPAATLSSRGGSGEASEPAGADWQGPDLLALLPALGLETPA